MCFGFKLASHVGLLHILWNSVVQVNGNLFFCFCRRNSLAVVEDTQHFPPEDWQLVYMVVSNIFFHPYAYLGKYFSDGLKPPTSCSLAEVMVMNS